MKREKAVHLFKIIILIYFCISIGVFVFIVFQKSSIMTPTQIYKQAIKSVVEIKASSENVGDSFGTAVFLTQDGIMVTNAHVVTYSRLDTTFEFDNYQIRFSFEDEYRSAELLEYDNDIDIAFLKVIDNDIVTIPIAVNTTSQLESGDIVYAVGNTSNYGISIAEGMVGVPLVNIEYSQKTREVIQCSIPIADGNSGGALLNNKGELVGLTSFRTKDKSGNIVYGIAYSVPIEIINQKLKELIFD